ncbi:MAG: PIN domain-containing protein [Acidobacteriota bacterium]|nr:PIN domain-containing protein [Acidobacteriota bacterium]
MRPVERSLVDANILVYAATLAAPQYLASRAVLESGINLCISPQVFAEFYSVVTNSKRVTAPFSPAEAGAFIYALLPRFEVLPMFGAVITRWAELAEKHSVRGADVFDLQLVATMLENGVRRIYTYNRSDFQLFNEIEVLTP